MAIVETEQYGRDGANDGTRAVTRQARAAIRRASLLPTEAMRDVADVFLVGCRKEGRKPFDWLHVPNWRTEFYDSLHRHLDAWWTDDEWIDEESGLPHLAAVVANALILLTLGRPDKRDAA